MLVTLALASLGMPKLAFVARFYHPHPDTRSSYDRLYMVDWDGRNRRLLSLPGQDCSQVMWVGRGMLVYEVTRKVDSGKTSLWTIRLPRGKPRQLAEEGSINKELTFESSRDGLPVLHTNHKQSLTVSPTSGKLSPLDLSKNRWYDPFKGADGSFVPNIIRSTSHVHTGAFAVSGDNAACLETLKGRVTIAMPIWVGFHEQLTNRLWVMDYPSMHSQRLPASQMGYWHDSRALLGGLFTGLASRPRSSCVRNSKRIEPLRSSPESLDKRAMGGNPGNWRKTPADLGRDAREPDAGEDARAPVGFLRCRRQPVTLTCALHLPQLGCAP